MVGVMSNDWSQQAKRFGRWVRAQRELKGMTAKAAAAKAGLDRDTWHAIEAGGRIRHGERIQQQYRPDTLVAVARALAAPIASVFEAAGRPLPGSDEPVELPDLRRYVLQLLSEIEELRQENAEIKQTLESLAVQGSTPDAPRGRRGSRRAPS